MTAHPPTRWLFLGLILALGGCGSRDSGAPPAATSTAPGTAREAKAFRLAMMPKLVGIDYYERTRVGAEEAAKELGIDLIYDGPPQDVVELQSNQIDAWVQLGVDAIAVAPNDPYVIVPAIRRAKEAGVLVLTWDADASPSGSLRRAFINPAPEKAVALALVEIMAAGIGGEGKTVIVSGSERAPNQTAWMGAMREIIAEKYPKITLLDPIIPDENSEQAHRFASEILKAHPDLKGIWGLSTVALPAVARAVREAGLSGRVAVTGLGLPSNVRPYLNDGTINKFVLWNPVDLGYLTVHAVQAAMDGALKPETETFGRLKGVKIQKDEIIMGPPIVIDRANIDQHNF